MDVITVCPPPGFGTGFADAGLTIFFAGLPLAILGLVLARFVVRREAWPWPDALHGIARFALSIQLLNALIVSPLAGAMVAVADGRAAWPVVVFLAASAIGDIVGGVSWYRVLRHTAETRLTRIAVQVQTP